MKKLTHLRFLQQKPGDVLRYGQNEMWYQELQSQIYFGFHTTIMY